MKKSLVIGLMVLGLVGATASESQAGIYFFIKGQSCGAKKSKAAKQKCGVSPTAGVVGALFGVGVGAWSSTEGYAIIGVPMIAFPAFQGEVQSGLMKKYAFEPGEARCLAGVITKLEGTPAVETILNAEGKEAGVYVRVPEEKTNRCLTARAAKQPEFVHQVADELSK